MISDTRVQLLIYTRTVTMYLERDRYYTLIYSHTFTVFKKDLEKDVASDTSGDFNLKDNSLFESMASL